MRKIKLVEGLETRVLDSNERRIYYDLLSAEKKRHEDAFSLVTIDPLPFLIFGQIEFKEGQNGIEFLKAAKASANIIDRVPFPLNLQVTSSLHEQLDKLIEAAPDYFYTNYLLADILIRASKRGLAHLAQFKGTDISVKPYSIVVESMEAMYNYAEDYLRKAAELFHEFSQRKKAPSLVVSAAQIRLCNVMLHTRKDMLECMVASKVNLEQNPLLIRKAEEWVKAYEKIFAEGAFHDEKAAHYAVLPYAHALGIVIGTPEYRKRALTLFNQVLLNVGYNYDALTSLAYIMSPHGSPSNN
jgi:hypothetical protein